MTDDGLRIGMLVTDKKTRNGFAPRVGEIRYLTEYRVMVRWDERGRGQRNHLDADRKGFCKRFIVASEEQFVG